MAQAVDTLNNAAAQLPTCRDHVLSITRRRLCQLWLPEQQNTPYKIIPYCCNLCSTPIHLCGTTQKQPRQMADAQVQEHLVWCCSAEESAAAEAKCKKASESTQRAHICTPALRSIPALLHTSSRAGQEIKQYNNPSAWPTNPYLMGSEHWAGTAIQPSSPPPYNTTTCNLPQAQKGCLIPP